MLQRSTLTGLPLAAALAATFTSITARSEPVGEGRVEEVLARAEEASGPTGSLEILKPALVAFPDDARIRHATAQAYLDDHNEFWALKVLEDFVVSHEPACDTRAFAASVYLGQANFDLAEQSLSTDACDGSPEVRARFALLRALVARERGDDRRARSLVDGALGEPSVYAEDLAAMEALSSDMDPGREPLGSWRLAIGLGWTQNGMAGSPQDPVDASSDTSSALGQLDASARLVVPASATVRPVVDVQLRTFELASEDVAFLSYRQPAIRPGLLFGASYPRLLVSYGFDALQIEGGDRFDRGPLWYSESHRADYELELSGALLVFGGAGHRTYREMARSRWEAEQGVAGGLSPAPWLNLMVGLTVRWAQAHVDAYDSEGFSAVTRLTGRLPGDFNARLSASLSVDDYPNSAGYFAGAGGASRTDAQVRLVPGLWSPDWEGVQVGVDYELSHRDSSAANYSYTDHRVLLHLVWSADSDPLGPPTVGAEGRVPMRYGLGSQGRAGADRLRIRDLMREDEAVKRGSSCLK